MIVTAALPCSNTWRVKELQSLVVKPVNKVRSPRGDCRVREGPNMRVSIKISDKKGR